jgi:hypothetical protein
MIELRDRARPQARLGSLLGAELVGLSVVGEQTHVLTHRKLRITIATAEVAGEPAAPGAQPYECFEWHGSAKLAGLGMSSLARKILLACPEST